MTATYELCFDPRAGEALIYRSIDAGICGPFSETVPCDTRDQAEGFAVESGYFVVGGWEAHRNYDSAPLVQR